MQKQSGYAQCQGITRNYRRCSKSIKSNEGFCKDHRESIIQIPKVKSTQTDLQNFNTQPVQNEQQFQTQPQEPSPTLSHGKKREVDGEFTFIFPGHSKKIKASHNISSDQDPEI